MVSVPGAIPVTTPPETVALAFELLHIPPGTGSESRTDDPVQTVDGPDMEPAEGTMVLARTL